jgi:acyl carrier protein
MDHDVPKWAGSSPAPNEVVRTTDPPALSTQHDHEVMAVLTSIVSDVLRVPEDQIRSDSALSDFPHVESIKLLRIAGKVERRFGIELDNEALFRRGTLGDLVREIVVVRDRAA